MNSNSFALTMAVVTGFLILIDLVAIILLSVNINRTKHRTRTARTKKTGKPTLISKKVPHDAAIGAFHVSKPFTPLLPTDHPDVISSRSARAIGTRTQEAALMQLQQEENEAPLEFPVVVTAKAVAFAPRRIPQKLEPLTQTRPPTPSSSSIKIVTLEEPAMLTDQEGGEEGEDYEEFPQPPGTGVEGVSWSDVQKPEQVQVIQAQVAELVVASYNIRCDKDPVPHRWMDREPHVLKVMKEATADVICLQEAKQEYAKELASCMGFWQLTGQPRKHRDEGTQIMFSRASMRFIDTRTFVLTDKGATPCPPASHCVDSSTFDGTKCKHVRIFTHTYLKHKVSGAFLHVINTHFPLEYNEQMVCAQLLQDYICTNIPQDQNFVMCGDFNSHYSPQSEQTPLSILLQTPLKDAHDLKDFSTYEDGFDGPALDNSQTHRLDFILYRPSTGLELVAADMIDARYGTGGAFRPSDHELLRVGFCQKMS